MLPIDALLPALLETLQEKRTVVLQAPPGAGKTTRVPLALLAAPWRENRTVLMLEPRRLAARSAADWMARQLGECVGSTVGYRTRLDSCVSSSTRIEVVTEGILIRLMQDDPALSRYAAVLFDEFHERSLHADLGLALVRESQQALREDLRLIVMSATLTVAPLAALLGDAPVLCSQGRAWPVVIHYRPPPRGRMLTDQVAKVIGEALASQQGSQLVFLPGAGEIRRVERLLSGSLPENVVLTPLYGDLGAAVQDAAIAPCPPGLCKIVLATAIAETSLTIEGIRVVIDAGQQRRAVFDPGSGMSRLATGRVSNASAEQRAGRAGRTEPGVCYRLWSESEQQGLAPFTVPEILEADLAPVVLELAQWGTRDPVDLEWLNPPPPAHWQQAVDLLRTLRLIDAEGGITAQGRQAQKLGIHPRLAHMVLRGATMGQQSIVVPLAALLGERDMAGPDDGADLHYRLQALAGEYRPPGLDRQRLERVRRSARAIQATLAAVIRGHNSSGPDRSAGSGPARVGEMLALAYPDRVAQRRPGGAHRFLLSNGRGARLREDDPLGQSPWLVAAALDGEAREARIFLAAAIDQTALESILADQIELCEEVGWDAQRGTVVARRVRRLGRLVLEKVDLPNPAPEQVEAGLLDAVRHHGIHSLPWTDSARQWQARVLLMRKLEPDQWPDVSEATLSHSLAIWFAPFLAGVKNWRGVQAVPLLDALQGILDYAQQRILEDQVPEAISVPSGQRVTLDYCAENGPVLAVKLQAMFGSADTPRLARGRVTVMLQLLSPARRPLALTRDLASFWQQAYPGVRKDMRGRYPRHPWPEDPLAAEPTVRTKQRSG